MPPADEVLDLARHRADLHQALLLLGAQPRQLVSLAFFRGLSHEEIAQQTHLPLGTVKSRSAGRCCRYARSLARVAPGTRVRAGPPCSLDSPAYGRPIMPSHLLPKHVESAPDPIDRELEPLLGESFASAGPRPNQTGERNPAHCAAGRLSACRLRAPRRMQRPHRGDATWPRSNWLRACWRARSTQQPPTACRGPASLCTRASSNCMPARSGRAGNGASPRMAGAPWFGQRGRMHAVAARLSRCAASTAAQPVRSDEGARLFLRESVLPPGSAEASFTVRGRGRRLA